MARANAHHLRRIAAWNATARPYPDGLRLGDLVAAGLTRDPDAAALRFAGRSMSRGELEARARALAVRLRAAGAGPGVLVGVHLERSVELVIALVGIVYSGAAYVPLDPTYPPERLRQMAEDAAMRVAVTGPVPSALEACLDGLQVLRIDANGAVDPPSADFTLPGRADDPAYVIFTSGSTGRPKGAANAHRGIVNRLLWLAETFPSTPADRVMQKTPYSFDVSVWEFFWPLIAGFPLVIARPGGHRDAAYLVNLIEHERVTILHFVPSMLRIFVEEPDIERCTSLRKIACSGEALPLDLAERVMARLPGVQLVNLYGPTEAAVDVSWWDCRRDDPRRLVPIGRPVANTQLHVLDDDMQPLAVGDAGELWIGGVQVGLGYVGRPALTAERFVPDPFMPGGRLYRTGDLARWLDDGTLEYLGRADQQLKVHGFRIEAGEVETAIRTHAAVRETVVTAPDLPGIGQQLVAHVVLRDDAGPAEAVHAELRTALRTRLPEFMVPTRWVDLAALPLTPSGKVDRRALPLPPAPAAHTAVRTEGAGPAGIDTLWQTLLGLPEPVDPDRNLFELGARSMLVMRFVAQLREAGEHRLGVADVYDRPTLRALAALLAQRPPMQVAAAAVSAAAAAPEARAQASAPVISLTPATHRPAARPAERGPLALMRAAGAALQALRSGNTIASARPRLVFAFPDQRRVRPGIARRPYDELPAFRRALDECSAAARPLIRRDLREWLVEARPDDVQAARSLATSRAAQPVLLALSFGFAAWLDGLGVRADVMVGYGAGEYVAACCAGMLNLKDTMSALVARGRAMHDSAPGELLAVDAGATAVMPLLPPGAEITAHDAPDRTVVGGTPAAIGMLETRLAERHLGAHRLTAPEGGQGPTLETAMPPVYAAMHGVSVYAPAVPVLSAGTAAPLRPADALDAAYWAQQLRAPAHFGRVVRGQIEAAARQGRSVAFVEVGPGDGLTPIVRHHMGDTATPVIALSLLAPDEVEGRAPAALEGAPLATSRYARPPDPVDPPVAGSS